jgi:Tfp pilus assembly protein PilZ
VGIDPAADSFYVRADAMEKRKTRRHTRRLRVRFGEHELGQSGFTSDVSSSGLFVVTSSPVNLGQRLHVEVTVDTDRRLLFEGVVARLTIVPQELRQVMKGGFGLRFLTGAELMAEMVPHLKDKVRLTITYPTAESFKRAWLADLQRGGVFAWSEKEQPLNSILFVELDLAFAQRLLSFEARVVHVVPGEDGRFGVALMFLEQQAALQALQALVPD